MAKLDNKVARSSLVVAVLLLGGCGELVPRDTASLLLPGFQRSEVVGFVAGLGTTFAALPDLIKMIKARSSKGINPTMAGIMALFQVLWIWYGFLIASRPVIVWNLIAVVINSITVRAYFRFAGKQAREQGQLP